MANTVIQLKYSTITSTPTLLNIAEPAYSYASNTLFIGSPTSDGVIAIGGKFYLDQQQQIFDKTNAAFNAANTGGSAASYANSAFVAANSAGVYANSAFAAANAANATDATQNSNITAASSYANSAFTAANTADSKAVSAGSYANAAFLQANTPSYTANSAATYANGAFTAANTKLSSSGGTITGDLSVTGNLTISGNTTYVNTTVVATQDSLIKLANNNITSDVLDIGFYGVANTTGSSAPTYTGLVRNAGANTYFLFKGLTADPSSNTLAAGSITAQNAATLIANVQAYAVTIGGVDVATNETRIFTQANSAYGAANAASSYANSAFTAANAAFLQANTPSYTANSAASYANSAFLAANTPSHVANSAASYANSAFTKANTDVTTISVSSGYFGNGATIASFTLEANGRISQANSTLIGIAASQITVGTLGVARGGTGASTFTNNGVLLGQGTSALTTASSSTEGHVLTINASGVPTFAHLQGGTF